MIKTAILLVASMLGVWHASAQGRIDFSTLGAGVNAPATNVITGQRIPAGNTFLAQLYYGPANSPWETLVSVTNPAVGFALDGFIVAGPRYLDPSVVAPGQMATFQVRLWEAVLGGSWIEAYANWLTGSPGVLGFTDAVQAPVRAFPDSPAYLTGLSGWSIGPVPEPASLALGLAGGGLLLWLGRRRAR